MKQTDQLIRQGEQYLLGMAQTYRRCWETACRHDGINPHTTFACFSRDNPYRPFLDRLVQEYQEALAAYLVWGYVGQRVSQR